MKIQKQNFSRKISCREEHRFFYALKFKFCRVKKLFAVDVFLLLKNFLYFCWGRLYSNKFDYHIPEKFWCLTCCKVYGSKLIQFNDHAQLILLNFLR